MTCGSAGSKSRLSKAAGAEVARKWHAAVARSTCASQNAKKHGMLGTCLDLQISKNGTPLWRQAHLQVKCKKLLRFARHLEVPMSQRYKTEEIDKKLTN